MLASQIPAKVPLPFANSGTKNAIPTASQIGITAGAASLTDGFPPLTFTPLASGGVPPSGADFNGIFNMITAVQQWQSAGGIFKYDAAFSALVGGYPKGSILMSTSNDTTWLNLADNNATNPDATDGSAANWAPLDAYGIAAIAGLTNANVTLTPAQSGKPIITLSGTLTGNVQVIFPATLQQWRIVNNTTGAFAVTCKTAAGTGGVVTQGASQLFYGNGTNLVPMPADARYEPLRSDAGQVGYFARNTAPSGWLKANGALVSRTTFSALFAAIGTTFGAGDGTTTFGLPDLRAKFLRSLDDGLGSDTGRTLGSAQANQNASHTHGVSDPTHAHSISDPGHSHLQHPDTWSSGPQYQFGTSGGGTINATRKATDAAFTGIGIAAAATGISIVAAGGNEARPDNIALLACIKF